MIGYVCMIINKENGKKLEIKKEGQRKFNKLSESEKSIYDMAM